MAQITTLIQLTASTHFPIKLTTTNFPVWRRQIQSTLVGLGLDDFITGKSNSPPKTITDKEIVKTNPDYTAWYRQDQVIFSAILGSCSDAIQPIIASASSAKEAWERLNTSYASSSRSRIISLKSKLAKNPKGNRSIAEFLNEMRSIADELALVQSPVHEEDLLVHILSQLGDEYTSIIAAIKVREHPISYPELFDKLVDFERSLKEAEFAAAPMVVTANYSQRQSNRTQNRSSNYTNRNSRSPSGYNNRGNRPSFTQQNPSAKTNRSSLFCQYCNIPGHETRECRKLARFLRDNNIPVSTSPVANATSSGTKTIFNQQPWLVDTGASHHLTSDRSTLHSVSEYGGPDEISLGDGTNLSISHTGHTHIHTSSRSLALPNTLCVPKLKNNLLSVAKLCRTNRVSVEFFPFYFLVKDLQTGAPLTRGENINDVYYLHPSTPQLNIATMTSPLHWHHKLGHPSARIFKQLSQILGLKFNSLSNFNFHCQSCAINKSHKLPFGPNSFTATKPLQLIYSDVWGPVQKSIDGYSYYVVFVDYYSKYVWLYPLKHKSDVSKIFPQFKLLVEKFFQTPIISIFSDNGGEYQGLASFLQSMGISHYTTPPHTPEQNGIAERRHRHIVETGLALLHFAGLPLRFWSHAFQTAVYLINRLPTPILDSKTPFHTLYGTNPNYSKLKTFGCLCYPWLRPYSTSKLDPRSQPCLFLGYSVAKSAYKCLHLSTQRLYHSRHVVFIEDQFPFKTSTQPPSNLPTATDFLQSPKSNHLSPSPPPTQESSTNSMQIPPTTHQSQPQLLQPILTATSPTATTHDTSCVEHPNHSFNAHPPISTSSSPSVPTPPPTPPPSPQITPSSSPLAIPTSTPPLPPRQRKPNPKYYNSTYVNHTTLHPLPIPLEPTTHNQASKDPLWRQAMDAEYNALIQNHTWDLVPSINHTPIGCKWIFRIKRNPDGSIAKYKARLVAKGFLQQYGKDYFDTFSPVTKPVTIRTVLSIALSREWPLRQLDINNAFLNGTLQEQVYMVQPPGYINPQFPNHICRLKKSLYGLKQAPRAWYLALTSFLLEFGFCKSLADASLFIYNREGVTCYFLVYVDDIVLTGNNPNFLNNFVTTLASRFSLKDLGQLSNFLGVEIIPTKDGLFLSQHSHIRDLLTRHGMDGAKVVNTPLSSSQVLTVNDDTPHVDPTPYRQLVGSLQYLAFTRPDISFAVNKLSQFMHSPTQTHWQALKRLLRYLKGTLHHGLFLNRKSPLALHAFSDSDWGGVTTAGRSTTAYILYLGSNIISWKSARQKSVSRSSTEAEYKALANAAAEIAWVQNLLSELGIEIKQPPQLYCDNTGATYVCANPIYHSRMKHIALDYHFVREKVAAGELKVLHVNSVDQLADVLTKPLSRAQFLSLRSKIGVSDGSSILRGQLQGRMMDNKSDLVNLTKVSFVNNIATIKGGDHVECIVDQIANHLVKVTMKEHPILKAHHVKNHLWRKTEVNKQGKLNIPKLEEDNYAATSESDKCTLILTEGDSAKAFTMCGLGYLRQNYYGIFRLLNVRVTSANRVWENDEIMEILNLQPGKTYNNVKSLRYRKVMLMLDQDPDESHMIGLLINFIHKCWPSLLRIPSFVVKFVAPIVKATNLKNPENVHNAIDLAFSGKRRNDRKESLKAHQDGNGSNGIDPKKKDIPIDELIYVTSR
ncbi:hypothetical protein OSB04_011041 [Centaurea solstitialis]|uniref:Integrase catalytic domain-containing protein n=1 Tax=Centaurea solstitialis TaxID=347529 RepID=A0AA38WDC4_9ASTR|nr:hypothetical protein OSB04_011041 [Centaurea solstitialis]